MAAERIRPLGELLREPIDDDRAERLLRQVLERHEAASSPTPRRAVWGARGLALVASAAVVALVAAAALLLADRGRDEGNAGPIRLATREALTALTNDLGSPLRRFELDDGSSIELSPGSSLQASRNTGAALELELSSGRARFLVEPGGPRRWRVDAGAATAEILGTIFDVDRRGGGLSIGVERGRVLVESELLESGSRVLTAGDRVVLQPTAAPAPEPPPAEEPGIATSDAGPPVAEVDAAPGAPLLWRRLAQAGDFRGAWDLLGEGGVRRLTVEAQTMTELLELADVARRSGHPREAVAPLELAIDRHRGDRRSAVAAFTLGRVEADALGHQDRAARAFARCLELGPPEALRETAHARLAQARAGAGDFEGARSAARDYLRRYPEGRQAEQLRRWVEPER